MQRTFALSLMVCAAFAQMAEPEPDAYTTSVEAEPASGADYYDVTLTANTHNLSFANQAEMISQMTTKIKENLEAGATVSIVIQSLNTLITYGGFTSSVVQADANGIINAVMALAGYSGTGVTNQDLTINDNFMFTRRLQASSTAKVVTSVPLTGDAVTTTHTLLGALTGSDTAFTTNLKTEDATKYPASFAASITESPKVNMKVKATVIGQSARPDAAATGTSVGTIFGNDLIAVTAEVSSMYTTTPESPESEDHAPIASMLTIWFALYALVVS